MFGGVVNPGTFRECFCLKYVGFIVRTDSTQQMDTLGHCRINLGKIDRPGSGFFNGFRILLNRRFVLHRVHLCLICPRDLVHDMLIIGIARSLDAVDRINLSGLGISLVHLVPRIRVLLLQMLTVSGELRLLLAELL